MQDIAILPGRSDETDEYLTPGGQFALGSELGMVMRIARISRHGALYVA